MQLRLLILVLAAAFCFGCGMRKYTITDPKLGSTKVTSKVKLSGESLETKTEAGDYPIQQVRVRLANGIVIDPSMSTATPNQRKGGVPIGLGIGVSNRVADGVRLGTGVGTGVTVGERIVPGPRDAAFIGIDSKQQPFTLVVEIKSDPVVTVDLPLGKVVASSAVTGESLRGIGYTRQEKWALPDGTRVIYYIKPTEDGVDTYVRAD